VLFRTGRRAAPQDAIAAIKGWVSKAFSRRGEEVVARNFAAIDHAVAALSRVQVPTTTTGATATHGRRPAVPAEAPDFVRRVTARMLEGRGDLLPVSALPVDGAFPTGTAQWEKRSLAAEIPIWDPSICIDCGKCAIVCPHATIRMKVFGPDALDGAPEGFASKDFRSRDLPGQRLTIQVAPDDAYLERERKNWDFFLSTRAGLGELAVRGQRRVRPGHPPGRRQPQPARPPAGRAARGGAGRRPRRAAPGRRPGEGGEAAAVAQRERVAELRVPGRPGPARGARAGGDLPAGIGRWCGRRPRPFDDATVGPGMDSTVSGQRLARVVRPVVDRWTHNRRTTP
jgi:ferredoxin